MASPEGPALAWCPFPDEDEARAVAAQLLDEGLIACVNIVPGMVSLYRWQGESGEAREAGALFKTDAALLPRLIARLEELHSYQSPAITGWSAAASNKATSDWLGSLVGKGSQA